MSKAGPPIENKAFRDLIKIVSQLEKRIKRLEHLQGYSIIGEKSLED